MSSISLQSQGVGHPLVDQRLDLLDRLLIGLVPRRDRLEMVRRSEERIQELLADLKTPEPTQEQVLEALARLEPPEALMTHPAVTKCDQLASPDVVWIATMFGSQPLKRPISRSAKTAFGLSATSITLILISPIMYLLVAATASLTTEVTAIYVLLGGYLVLIAGSSLGGALTALFALWQLRRRRGTHVGYGWATAALLMSLMPLLISSLLGVYATMALRGMDA
ncbi:MAG: hypothetical protein ACKV0T_20300 [Planctomycetales bacterium]